MLQYRLVPDKTAGRTGNRVKPYIIDLGSTNKTFLNGSAIDPQRYYELREKDVLKFGAGCPPARALHCLAASKPGLGA